MKQENSVITSPKKNNFFLLFIFVLINISELSYGQNNECGFLQQTQYYAYNNEYINMTFETNKMCMNEKDTLIVNVKVKNISFDSIYFIKDNYYKKKISKDGIIFENGGSFTGGSIYDVEMIKVGPGSSFSSSNYVLIKDLKKDGFKSLVHIILSLGYVINFDSIKSNYIDNKKNQDMYYYYKDNSLIMSSSILELFMKNIDSANLWISIKE